eukprot:COSAG02_NODE_2235_length_9420_cov_27.032722_6_plen_350_part_00
MVDEELLGSFQRHGFAVLAGVMPLEVVQQLRDELLDPTFDALFDRRSQAAVGARCAIGKEGGAFKEHSGVARAMSPLLLDNRMLSFAEAVLGSAAQLDSFRVTCFPSLGPEHCGAVELGGWHVDRFSHSLPEGARDWTPRRPSVGGAGPSGYCPPRAINCIGYLQDMDRASGPLRVVTGSHLISIDYALGEMVPAGSERVPLPQEQLVRRQSFFECTSTDHATQSSTCRTVTSAPQCNCYLTPCGLQLRVARSIVLQAMSWCYTATRFMLDQRIPRILTVTLFLPICPSQRFRFGTSTLARKGRGMIWNATPYGSSSRRGNSTRAKALWGESVIEGSDNCLVGFERIGI